MSILISVVLIVLNHFISSSVALVPGYKLDDHGKAFSLLSLLINHHYSIKLTYVRPDNKSVVIEAEPPLELFPVKVIQEKPEALRKSHKACAKFMNTSYGREVNPLEHMETENISNSSSTISKNMAKLQPNLKHFGTRVTAARGIDTIVGEYPHLAALGSMDDSGDFIHRCTGTLIDRDWILTAAHCIDSTWANLTTVRLGVTNLRHNTDGETLGIKQIFRHPSYKPPQIYYDIALLELDRPIHFSSSIKPACLYQNSDDVPEEAWVGGWNTAEFGECRNNVLQKSRVTVYDKDRCSSEIRPSINISDGFLPSMICTSSPGDDWCNDTCQGASGGPLHIQLPGQHLFSVVGIASSDINCKVPGSPRLFSHVPFFLQWIENIVWPDSD